MRSYLLNNVDRFFYALGYWSRILGWIAIAMGLILLARLIG
jgi:hypothetical protein